jgi:hypothetical protein
MPDRTTLQRANHFDKWYNAVADYTSRNLAFTTDILPALSSLASTIFQIHSCTYKSGLWLKDLQIGLCWCVRGYDRPESTRDSHNPTGGFHNSSMRSHFWSWRDSGFELNLELSAFTLHGRGHRDGVRRSTFPAGKTITSRECMRD